MNDPEYVPPEDPRSARRKDPPAKPPETSLRRELTAIAVLYVVLSVLPLLIGLAFAPR